MEMVTFHTTSVELGFISKRYGISNAFCGKVLNGGAVPFLHKGTVVLCLFGIPVGHFHTKPVGPHPRGSCQLTVRPDQFGDFAQWIALNRKGLTIFAHTSTGEDFADHTEHVIWFGPSETLDLSIFAEAL